MSVAIATCAAFPHGDDDAELLKAALAERGIDADWRSWTDAMVDWAGYDLVIIRSTWDYPTDATRFREWVAATPNLLNPADVVAWNTDKIYLRDLTDAGVPVVATYWVAPGEPFELPDADEFVVKPSVGAGSKGAGRFARGDAAALAHARALHAAGRVVMAQPYLAGVDTAGETALIYIDGEFSHAIGKAAMLPVATVHDLDVLNSRSFYVEEKISSRTPEPPELALGEQALRFVRAKFGSDLLYARVDLLPTADGPVIVELELIEPSLFLEFAPGSADRLADAITRRVGRA